tara:strand:- start:716 stop:1219 length:504 start_codon:yes stop_codon:yes gene_type:complete
MSYKDYIDEVPDFPVEGVNFKDLSPLLSDEKLFRTAIIEMGRKVEIPDFWVGIDSRGYVFASALSMMYGGGVVCARKEGKTPGDIVSVDYDLEYGSAKLEMQKVGMGYGEVVIVDDVLATGGTLQATNYLAEKAGYNVIDSLVLVDLKFVPRIDNFNLEVKSVIEYE